MERRENKIRVFFLFWCVRNFTTFTRRTFNSQTSIVSINSTVSAKIIICRNFVGFEYVTLHKCTKFSGYLLFGSGEEVLKDFIIYGSGGHLDHVTFCSSKARNLYRKSGFNR